MEVVDKATGNVIVVPAFLSPDGDLLIVNPPSEDDIGDYEVRVCSKIHNSLLTVECTTVNFSVVPAPAPESGIIYSVEPDFIRNLKD